MISASAKSLDQNAAKPKVVRIIGRLNVGGPARQACFLHQALRSTFDTVLIAGHLDKQEGDMRYPLNVTAGPTLDRFPSVSRHYSHSSCGTTRSCPHPCR